MNLRKLKDRAHQQVLTSGKFRPHPTEPYTYIHKRTKGIYKLDTTPAILKDGGYGVFKIKEEYCRNRALYIISLFAPIREEEFPVDNDPYFMEPRRAGNTGVPRPRSDHYPRKGVQGIPTGNPNAQERKIIQNTFPWGGTIRNPQQLHLYGDQPSGGVSSGVGGVTN